MSAKIKVAFTSVIRLKNAKIHFFSFDVKQVKIMAVKVILRQCKLVYLKSTSIICFYSTQQFALSTKDVSI